MKLIIEPADGVRPLLTAINSAKKSVEIAVFRFDRKDIESALKAAATRGVKVTALIAFANRGGEHGLRQLELRCLDAGIIVARTSDDLVRYHDKYILVDRRVLCMLSFNFTHQDIARSRGFGIDDGRTLGQRSHETVPSRLHSDDLRAEDRDVCRQSGELSKVLGTFLKRARRSVDLRPQDLDKVLRILQERGSRRRIRVIGSAGRAQFDVQRLAGIRLHTRTIIRDRRQAFIGSQSLRIEELTRVANSA